MKTMEGCGFPLLSGFVLDPGKYRQLSLEERRQMIHEIAKWPEEAPEVLSSLSRRELLEIICLEMGKERKYSSLTKLQMIEHLLRLVSMAYKKNNADNLPAASLTKTKSGFKRQRKQEGPLIPHIQTDYAPLKTMNEPKKVLCQNVVCQATLSTEDAFCKRCSCCICHQYDENKDPSLWITCNSDSCNEEESCGVSCHLKCALEHKQPKQVGTLRNDFSAKLDGGYFCVSCGKSNGLMRTWRKQLLAAKDARRVDVFCLRVSLSHKILEGTDRYKVLLKIIESIVIKLENEVGSLDWASSKMDRSLVNRLSCSTEIQKLCTYAVEAFDSMFNPCSDYVDQKRPPTCQIHFEDLSPTTVIVALDYNNHLFEGYLGCKLWYRNSTVEYPEEAAFVVLGPKKRFRLTDLDPSTEYICKVSFFSSARTLGAWEAKWLTPALSESSIKLANELKGEEENMTRLNANQQMDTTNTSGDNLFLGNHISKCRLLNDINNKKNHGFAVLPSLIKDVRSACPTSSPPSTPCKPDENRKLQSLVIKKHTKESDYEYSVGVIRWLEHEGLLNTEFRVKFLTWFSLKATMQERRVVSAFVDTLGDDPPSLAGQLIDTFTDEIYPEQNPKSWLRFCSRLWH